MPFTKQKPDKICIICRKRERTLGSLFCRTCFRRPFLVKINALRESREYKEGWVNTGAAYHYGRLPKR